LVLFFGGNRYVRSPPPGSVLALLFNAFGYAARGRWSLNPVKTIRILNAPDFWEAAKPNSVVVAGKTGRQPPRVRLQAYI
ncbi:hypothetical protein R3P38DRAFT_2461781, partial [Favolaschia claudopus]